MRCYLGKGFSIFFRSRGFLSSLTSTLNEVQHTNESFPTFSKFIGFLSSMNALISCGVQIFNEGISTLILYPFTKRVITTRSKLWKISTLFKSMILSYATNSKLCFKLQVEKAVALKDSLISKEALFQFSQSLLFSVCTLLKLDATCLPSLVANLSVHHLLKLLLNKLPFHFFLHHPEFLFVLQQRITSSLISSQPATGEMTQHQNVNAGAKVLSQNSAEPWGLPAF